jgi:xanthine dehydrogenase accessory factor
MMLDTATAGVMPRRFSQAGNVAPDDSAAVFGLLAAVARAAAAIALRPDGGIELARAGRTGWSGASFRRTYLPPLRLAVFGRGLEFEALVRLATAAGYPVAAFAADEASTVRLEASGIGCARHSAPAESPELALDDRTAVLLLFHDHEWELQILEQALASDCLYIGALGSANTHRRRCEMLLAHGHRLETIDRIRGPIGLFGPTRDASSLAISVLAELAQLQSSS